MLRYLMILPLCLTLTACGEAGGKIFEGYRMPTGYANLDTTPLSSPPGYDRTPTQEGQIRDVMAADREAWRNGIASALMPISSVLDMNQPVAVVARPSMSPLNASAAHYTRDLLVDMSYLVGLQGQTKQEVHVDADRIGPSAERKVKLHVSVKRDGLTYASRTIDIIVPHQAAETRYFPDVEFIDNMPPPAAPLPPPATYNDDRGS